MTREEREKTQRDDLMLLLQRPEFIRFLWRVIQLARIFDRTTDGSEGRILAFDEGRRNLGLEILEMVEAGQPVSHPEGQPILTLLQALREEAIQQPQEKKNDGPGKHDRYHDIDGDGE
jgi:hypothetical protein